MIRITSVFALTAAVLFHGAAVAQKHAHGTVERVTLRGRSLEGNLLDDPAARRVSVYLPPSYKASPARRYPVLYLLHGYNDDDDQWFGRVRHFIDVPRILDRAMSAPGAREQIVVMPNARNRLGGSMYSTSITIGDWESFVVNDLVSFIDARYRTVAASESRGLAGHSMGGYGALKLVMKYPGVFSAVYAMSPCCMTHSIGRQQTRAEHIRTLRQFDSADFATRSDVAAAAAWSPNPSSPPLFADMWTRDGKVQPDVFERWMAQAPLAIVDRYMGNLRRLRAIAFDAADADIPGVERNAREFSRILDENRIEHAFEVYVGTHLNRIAARFEQKILPFFWAHLTF